MSSSHPFGWQDLKEISEKISKRPLSGIYAYDLSVGVILHMLEAAFYGLPPEERTSGREWIQKHVISSNPERLYLRPQADNDPNFQLHLCRVIELAELLFNLRMVPRIRKTYRRIANDPGPIEATIVELECLRLLCFAKLPFRLPLPAAIKGKNYDCEIMLPSGIPVYCEMKCKLEDREFSSSSVKNTLDHARKQLPKGECGIIFLKVPPGWLFTSDETSAALHSSRP